MIAHTSPLPQSEATSSSPHTEQTQTNKNMDSRAGMLRRMLPGLLINALVPFAINLLAQPHMSTINALLLASSVPALFTVGSLIWKKHVDAVGLLVVAGLLLSAVFALVLKSPRLLLLQGSAVNGLFGCAMLLSLLFPRPILFYVIRSVTTQNDPRRVARFNADWAFPQFRAFYRTLTLVWGCLMTAQILVTAVLAFTLPISLMLVLGPAIHFGMIVPAVNWSMYFIRRHRSTFEQLRQQRDPNTPTVA